MTINVRFHNVSFQLVDMYSNRVDNDDNGDLISFDDSCLGSLPSKHDIISTLSVGGRWVTSQNDLQVNVRLLYTILHISSHLSGKQVKRAFNIICFQRETLR